MKKIIIRAELQNLAKREILEMVPVDTLARIKETDSNPEFKVFCVGHEGVANAQELSFGGKVVKAYHYVKNMIFKLGDKLQYNTPIFHNHGDTNDQSSREKIGELVSKSVKMVGDKLSALVVTYIYPQFKKLDLDIASVEGEVEYTPKGISSGDVIDIHKITGIALGSSKMNTPAFPGATLLGTLQAFSKESKGDEKMTKEEILEAIKEGKFKVGDLFSKEEILETDIVKTDHKDAHDHARRVEKQLGDEREKIISLTKSIEEKDGKLKVLNEQVSRTQVGVLFTKSNEARKFNDKQKAFIERRLSTFRSDKSGDELQLEFDKYLDKEILEFGEVAKMMGVKVEETTPPATGTPNTDGKHDGKELDKPENNEFIPKE